MSVLDKIAEVVHQPRVFISYTSVDRPFVEWLAASLEATGVRFWVDYREIRVGDSIVDEVTKGLRALRAKDALIVVLSKASVESRWVREELNAALVSMMEGSGIRLCPALIEPCDVPTFLRQRRYADFAKDRQAALRELLESLAPDSKLWEDIELLLETFRETVEGIPLLPSKVDRWRGLADLDILLTTALSKRYQIQFKDDLSTVSERPDFYTQFAYLEAKGFRLKSKTWAALRDFRNQFVHHYPGYGLRDGILLDNDPKVIEQRTSEAERRAAEAASSLDEVTSVMETLCTR